MGVDEGTPTSKGEQASKEKRRKSTYEMEPENEQGRPKRLHFKLQLFEENFSRIKVSCEDGLTRLEEIYDQIAENAHIKETEKKDDGGEEMVSRTRAINIKA